ncbi:hypothetical protein ACP70R_011897 [Stipagrostis hirtigluma subsp. patula]
MKMHLQSKPKTPTEGRDRRSNRTNASDSPLLRIKQPPAPPQNPLPALATPFSRRRHLALASASAPPQERPRPSRIQDGRVLQNDIDLLNPPAELEKLKHKKKRLVQSPNSFFMDVKCQGCFNMNHCVQPLPDCCGVPGLPNCAVPTYWWEG